MVRVLASSTLVLHLLGVALAQDPPNHADSTVPYTLPSTPKYDYAEVIHKVRLKLCICWKRSLLTGCFAEFLVLSCSAVGEAGSKPPTSVAGRLVL